MVARLEQGGRRAEQGGGRPGGHQHVVGVEAVAAGGHRLPQQRVAEVVAVAEEQLVEVELEAEVAQAAVGHGALGEVVGDGVVAELLGRLDLDGHPSVAHVRSMAGGRRLPPVPDPAALVDLDRYPVLDLDGAGAPVVAHHAAELRDTGVSILPGFLRADALPALVAECDALAAGAHLQDVQGTPYLELPDPDAWPADHPRVTWARSAVHTVAYDRFSRTHLRAPGAVRVGRPARASSAGSSGARRCTATPTRSGP